MKTTIPEIDSKTIRLLRFPLIIMVLYVHCFGPGEVDMLAMDYSSLSGMDCFNIFRVFVTRVLCHVAIPSFFIISGYLFFRGTTEWNCEVYTSKLRSRVKTLLIPYLIWNLIYLIYIKSSSNPFDYVAPFVSNMSVGDYFASFWNLIIGETGMTNWLGQPTPNHYPINFPLWYVRDLMVLVVLSPLIRLFVKHTRKWGLLMLALCYVSSIWPNYTGIQINGVLFFSVGAYLGVHQIDMVDWFRRHRRIIYPVAAVLALVTLYFGSIWTTTGLRVYKFFVLFGTASTIALAGGLARQGKANMPALLSNSAFFIMAVHMIEFCQLGDRLYRLIFSPESALGLTICYIVVPFMVAGMCIALFALLKKLCPPLLKLLNGGRV